MKLKLSQRKDVAILDVEGDLSIDQVPALRAGIAQFLKSGKNKIVLNLGQAKKLPIEALREILQLQILANELKGSIAIAGKGELVKQAVESFKSPEPIRYYSTAEAAVQSLTTPTFREANHPEKAADDYPSRLKSLEQENKILSSQIKRQDLKKLTQLQGENTQLKAELRKLREQVRKLIEERKKPFENAGYETKIRQLEAALDQCFKGLPEK